MCTPTRPQGIYMADNTQEKKYWPISHELAMIDGVAVKGERIIMLSQLLKQILNQLHSNYMGIEKMSLLESESVYWVNMNTEIENTIKHFSACLEYQNMQLQEKTRLHEILAKLWEVFDTHIFMVNNQTSLCIVDYYSKLLIVEEGGEHVNWRPDMGNQTCIC